MENLLHVKNLNHLNKKYSMRNNKTLLISICCGMILAFAFMLWFIRKPHSATAQTICVADALECVTLRTDDGGAILQVMPPTHAFGQVGARRYPVAGLAGNYYGIECNATNGWHITGCAHLSSGWGHTTFMTDSACYAWEGDEAVAPDPPDVNIIDVRCCKF